ncbi:Endonuclease/exonuclease/phosphatase [Mycena sp. CBHHK59/15]|nr:Endonuclease/exonuclease/phosphatase [Mycena sp. CBHHK59/15]
MATNLCSVWPMTTIMCPVATSGCETSRRLPAIPKAPSRLDRLASLISTEQEPSAAVLEEVVHQPSRSTCAKAKTPAHVLPTLPPNTKVVHPPKSLLKEFSTRETPPHRPAPQLSYFATFSNGTPSPTRNPFTVADAPDTVLSDTHSPDVTSDTRSGQASSDRRRRGGIDGELARSLSPPLADRQDHLPARRRNPRNRQKSKEKETAFLDLKSRSEAAESFDELASLLTKTVTAPIQSLSSPAVAEGRGILAGAAPTVVRGFPHLRVAQCWGCLKFGHTKARCTVNETKCGTCGETVHGAICSSMPQWLNCGEAHRADSFMCPTRRRIAEVLRMRAVELTKSLNQSSSIRMIKLAQTNQWKSRNPLNILTSSDDFDSICTQEPNINEALHSSEHPNYALIHPDAANRHRVSVYVKLSKIPLSSICPRPDLSPSGDIIVIDCTFGTKKVTIINLYNDSTIRAGVEILRQVLLQLDPPTQIFVVMDSNSHHPLWDSKMKTANHIEDFELHDLLITHPLLLLTPPDVPTHSSGNVIDLGFCSPGLFISIHDVAVDADFCVSSDHLPITYKIADL